MGFNRLFSGRTWLNFCDTNSCDWCDLGKTSLGRLVDMGPKANYYADTLVHLRWISDGSGICSQGIKRKAICFGSCLTWCFGCPLIYMSSIWWRTVHPDLNIGPFVESGGLDSSMRLTFWMAFIAFTVFYIYILVERIAMRRAEDALDEVHQYVARSG